MEAIKWIWPYIRKYKLRMCIGLTMVLMASGLGMVNPYMSEVVVDRVINGGQSDILIKLIAIILGATLLRSIIRYVFQMIFDVSQNIILTMRKISICGFKS